MFLKHEDYVEPVKSVRVVPDVKQGIKDFVGNGKRSYEDIVKEIQKGENMTNDEIIAQIKEVHDEWYLIVLGEVVE